MLRKTDDAGQLLAGACFALRSGDRAVYSICDNDASDANTSAGVILLGTVAPGTYTLRETQPPTGYLGAADQEVTISANQRSQISVVDPLVPQPQHTGDLRVFKLDTGGSALAGSCFAVVDGEGQVLVPRCDADDGADNGVVLMEGIAPGEYSLRETRRPSADYQTAADVLVEVVADQTVDVEVVNQLRAGRILIRKTDPNGLPLAGACFDLVEDGAGASCTDENGELLFAALAPGVYRVMETAGACGIPRRAGHRSGHGQTGQHGDARRRRPAGAATTGQWLDPGQEIRLPRCGGRWRHRLRRLLRPRWRRAGPDRRL